MARRIATNTAVDREGLLEFLRSEKRAVLTTYRKDGGLQMSPVVYGVDDRGRVLVSTYPSRAKAANIRRRPQVSLCILGADFDDAWVQINGLATVIDLPDSVEVLVEYFRAVGGEHPNWQEYREAMVTQGKSVIVVEIESWGPIATGGFPATLAQE
ncbi:PPOX class F420-dependent oxidoreductase [Jonesia denitrificans]|uniref:Pyridoxamine 5'-phosphate oxidase-related FMN-binding n=1 Tax=Jonesia denitrificans (strain ATCC 14870 / DSM 20603 / BCRC 15368 / CIP 55.134 / JCM 11481 / NBRC 15587 / NCTC 10816 / Prevot 55134) TaxID=471856 RepID=C7R3V2_JONDD|nr:PPOX class F420-dependent oxidoreductase [Jonesia denitrificans]ACV08809.1 pyridoxamine 5'-phosphate oxidase-related FMN- binding [Jonesia denitrificans DSM 20603]ASE09869.1 PPOX class F420-dependent oxidoreductase [Jonesia denitrificans]QXB44405.1 PPOX class F420-dependent oxidoreductase [Jonesia denitrificans]SQH20798.1 Putative pyridoxine/pyridoxamine 5'-phosphate oxidase [Jonesia denitrificans]